MILGFISYGLSIFLYIRAQSTLGAAKTSAYYAVAPFIGVFLSFLLLHEQLTVMYLLSLIIMIAGTMLAVADTLLTEHSHLHKHTFSYVKNGIRQTCTIEHSHEHNHYCLNGKHYHYHTTEELLLELKAQS